MSDEEDDELVILARGDLADDFPPDLLDLADPVLLTSSSAVHALGVSALLLRDLARKGGTRIKTSALDELVARVSASVPAHVMAHLEDEAARTARWLARHPAPEQLDDGSDDSSRTLALMEQADVASRARLVELALELGLDLELEYHDDGEWWRVHVTPVEVRGGPDWTLEVELFGAPLELQLSDVRWLMPVRARPRAAKAKKVADVLSFPFGKLTRVVVEEE